MGSPLSRGDMKSIIIFLVAICFFTRGKIAFAELPEGFVYLKYIDASIQQDMRYATRHNFVGHPIDGYFAAECILTKSAAVALSQVQKELKASSLSLKVYDCYRPLQAVSEFIAWSQLPDQQQMKVEFYPRVDKADFFKLGYVAEKSGHTRGSTVDLTIVSIPVRQTAVYSGQKPLVACFAPFLARFQDGSIDMGTGFDCMDEFAHNDNTDVSVVAQMNRQLLKKLMEKHGFLPYEKEWWHFTLKNEPYLNTYFNFPVKKHL